MDITSFAKANLADIVEYLSIDIYDKNLDDLGCRVKNGVVYDLRGKYFAESEEEALDALHEKLNLNKRAVAPGRIELFDNKTIAGKIAETSKNKHVLISVDDLWFLGSKYDRG